VTLTAIDHGFATELRFSRLPALRDQVSAWRTGAVLVDAGGELTASDLAAWLRDHPVELVVLGHSHEDHTGGAARLVAGGLPVHASSRTAARLRRPARVPGYRSALWGSIPALRVRPPDGLPLAAIGLPGHAPDHTGWLDERSGVLFSGDLVLRRRQRVAMPGEDPYRRMESLRRVLALRPERLATSHLGVIDDPPAVLVDELGYLEKLGERIRSRHGAGATVDAIVRELFGGEPLMSGRQVTWRQATRGEFSARRWVSSFLPRASARAR
jgi:glyoxylase-like metal-dependent hydrolase (beta-lactamase superfamily II)